MKTLKRISALLLAVLLMASFSITAFAGEYDIGAGSVTVNATTDTQTVTHGSNAPVSDSTPVITGTSTLNTVTINTDSGATANVTLKDVNISSSNDAAVSTSGSGNVNIELDGTNTVNSGYGHAGVEKGNSGSLIITDSNNNGSLDATGGRFGAGIGGGDYGNADNITINNGTVNATGGFCGAGIGGGNRGNTDNITINNGTVNATGNSGAGIGGGYAGNANNITINNGTVSAYSNIGGAGIGGGNSGSGANGNASDIAINGGTVYAAGSSLGAGIGGSNTLGTGGTASGITVSGDATVHVAGGNGSSSYSNWTDGAAIGSGGGFVDDDDSGAEIEQDPSKLTTGSISYYPAGTTVEQMKDGSVGPVKIVEPLKPDPQPDPVDPDPPKPEPKPTPVGPMAAVTYKLKFDLGGGVMPDGKTELELKCSAGQKITLPEAPAKEGFTFVGWETTVRGKTVILDAGAKFTVTAAKTFVALWEEA